MAIAHDSPQQQRRVCAGRGWHFLGQRHHGVSSSTALRPTPELSFAIRQLGCQSGCVITASHNPKEYNGYKVYWNDGAQVVAPHDKNIIAEVNRITGVGEVKFDGRSIRASPTSAPTLDEPYLHRGSEA
ncbi:MAG: hypothetical protein WKG07_15890 [Hymenobacter sp.]